MRSIDHPICQPRLTVRASPPDVYQRHIAATVRDQCGEIGIPRVVACGDSRNCPGSDGYERIACLFLPINQRKSRPRTGTAPRGFDQVERRLGLQEVGGSR
jgi:hypothetical protein